VSNKKTRKLKKTYGLLFSLIVVAGQAALRISPGVIGISFLSIV